jgi:hypothetical protein
LSSQTLLRVIQRVIGEKNHSKKSELLTQLIRGIWLIFFLKNAKIIEKTALQVRKNPFFSLKNGFWG